MNTHVLLLATSLLAAVEVEPAKLMTADASPVDPGSSELAIGGTWTMAERHLDAAGRAQDRSGDLRERGMGIGFTYGIVEDLDAGIGIGWMRVEDAATDPGYGSGPTDLEFAGKWRFWRYAEGDAVWAAALLPAITAPLGRSQDPESVIPTACRFWTAGLTVAGSGSIGIVALNADAGYVHACGGKADREGYRGTLAAHAAIGVQLADWIQPEVELSWDCDRLETDDLPWSMAVTVGAQLSLPFGRLGLGLQRVVDGVEVDEASSGIADLAIGF